MKKIRTVFLITVFSLAFGQVQAAAGDVSSPPLAMRDQDPCLQLEFQTTDLHDARAFKAVGQEAYVLQLGREHPDTSFLILDISDPQHPVVLGSCPVPEGSCDDMMNYSDIIISGHYAYVGGIGCDLTIIDISDSTSPSIVNTVTLGEGFVLGYAIRGEWAYVTVGQSDDHGNFVNASLIIINIRDPLDPQEVSTLDFPWYVTDILLMDHYAYLGSSSYDLYVVDIADPYAPVVVGDLSNGPSFDYLSRYDHYIYGVGFEADFDYPSLYVIDIADPENPTWVSSAATGYYDCYPWCPMMISAGTIVYVGTVSWDRRGAFGTFYIVFDLSDPHEPLFLDYIFMGDQSGFGTAVSDADPMREKTYIAGYNLARYDLSGCLQGPVPTAGYMWNSQGFQVTFTDTSTENPTSFFWDFGDYTWSTEESPVHIYAHSGTYNVTLTVENANGRDIIRQRVTIERSHDRPFDFPEAAPTLP